MEPPREHDAQRDLPLASLEEAEAAYLAAVEDLKRFLRMPGSRAAVLRQILCSGRRDSQPGTMVWQHGSRRNGAKAAGLPLSSFSRAVKRLVKSRLVIESDGALRLVLPRLVEVAEDARARAAPDYGGFDAADALRLLSPGGERSALFHGDPRCSTGARSVKKDLNTPVPYPSLQRDLTERAPRDTVGQRGPARDSAGHPGALAGDPAWRALQTCHFRPRLNLGALTACFDAAAAAGLLDDQHDARRRFLATAFDLAADRNIRAPAAVLRSRIERGTCYRQSDRAMAWAKQILARGADDQREVAAEEKTYAE